MEKVKGNKIRLVCSNCNKIFYRYLCRINTDTPCCGYSCSNQYSKKNNPYVRDKAHRVKMSQIISDSDHEGRRQTIIAYNKSKGGLTYEDFYGKERADEIKEKLAKSFTGELNPNYIDGRSFLPYPPSFNKQIKRLIKKLDSYTCARCGVTEEECIERDSLGRGLTIHHIDFDKNNCSQDNLIATCRSCNSWSNFNRESSVLLFNTKISERNS